MALKSIVTAVLVFTIFTAGAFAAYQVADTSQDSAAQEQAQATDENLVVKYGYYQFVDQGTAEFTTGFNETVTVENQSGVELVRGTDYEWNGTDGTIRFFDTQNTTENNTAAIDYGYQRNTEAVQDVSAPLSGITQGIGLLPIAAGGLGFVVLFIGFATSIGKFFGSNGPGSGR